MKQIKYFFISALFCALSVRADNTSVADTTTLLEGYHTIQIALAGDDFNTTKKGAQDLVKIAQDWIAQSNPEDPQLANVQKVQEGTQGIANGTGEKEYRDKFIILAEGVIGFIKQDKSLQTDWNLYFCPMVTQYWAEPKTDPKKMNPYMGTSMQHCGSLKPWS